MTITTHKHSETMMHLAEQHLKSLLADTPMTLRDVSAEGLVLEADATTSDLTMTNALHALASHWGYAHGECPTTVEALPGGFFTSAKRATLTFAAQRDTSVADAVYALHAQQTPYFRARAMLGDAANLCDGDHAEVATAIRDLLATI